MTNAEERSTAAIGVAAGIYMQLALALKAQWETAPHCLRDEDLGAAADYAMRAARIFEERLQVATGQPEPRAPLITGPDSEPIAPRAVSDSRCDNCGERASAHPVRDGRAILCSSFKFPHSGSQPRKTPPVVAPLTDGPAPGTRGVDHLHLVEKKEDPE